MEKSDDCDIVNRKRSEPKIDEDSDHYEPGKRYNDSNGVAIVDNDYSARPLGYVDPIGAFRKHKQNKAKLVRKRKVKKCKCK